MSPGVWLDRSDTMGQWASSTSSSLLHSAQRSLSIQVDSSREYANCHKSVQSLDYFMENAWQGSSQKGLDFSLKISFG